MTKSLKKRRVLVLTLGLMTVLAPLAYSQAKKSAALLYAKELIASKKYRSAQEALTNIIKTEKSSALAQEAWLLQARALHLQDSQLKAIAELNTFLTRFPRSRLRKRALHLLAQAYHKTKKYKLAARITRGELEEVASDAYRIKLARLYLDLGDQAYRGKEVATRSPGKTRTVRDYQKASGFYTSALAIKVPADLEAPVRMHLAECQTAMGKHSQAAATLAQLIKNFPESDLLYPAHFELGQAHLRLGQREEARAEFRLLEKHSPNFAARAAQRLGDSYMPKGHSSKEAKLLGISHWKRILEKYKDYKDTAQVHKNLAETYFKMGRYGDSESSYRSYLSLSEDDGEKG